MERMRALLLRIPSMQAGGLPQQGYVAFFAPLVRGTNAEIDEACLDLVTLGLISTKSERVGRTREGDRVVREAKSGAHHSLALTVIRSGLLAEQIRDLLFLLDVVGTDMICSASKAKRTAPQLVGLVAQLPGVRITGSLVINEAIGLELDSSWNQWHVPPMAKPETSEERQQVGDRGELYSLQMERTAFIGAGRSVVWVSRDDYKLGWDIEVQVPNRVRRIEVKGSRGREVTFILSKNEYNKASKHGTDYEIHFWGDIRLTATPAHDYARLRDAGYPIVITDPTTALDTEDWIITPTEYRVRSVTATSGRETSTSHVPGKGVAGQFLGVTAQRAKAL